MIHISEPNTFQAKCVLLHVRREIENRDGEGSISLHPYVNCREQGFNLTAHLDPASIGKHRSVSFSECRNSDSIMVYFGTSENFAFNTYIPDDVTYNKAKSFGYGKYEEAAEFIVDYLLADI